MDSLGTLFDLLGYIIGPAMCLLIFMPIAIASWFLAGAFQEVITLFQPAKVSAVVAHAASQKKEIKLLAIDHLMMMRRQKEKDAARRMHEILNSEPAPARIKAREQREAETEFSLDALEKYMNPPKPKPRPESRKDLWSLAQFPEGPKRPKYLVFKKATKEGLKTAFANLPSKKLTMSLDAAKRWVPLMPAGTCIVAANINARLVLKELETMEETDV